MEEDEVKNLLDNSSEKMDGPPNVQTQTMSKNSRKKLLKQQKYEEMKAKKKLAIHERRKNEAERKRKEWDDTLTNLSEEERMQFLESRKLIKMERIHQQTTEKESKMKRLIGAKRHGQKIVLDLEFSHLMTPTEMNSLLQQIMYCYAINRKSSTPAHLWLAGYEGEMEGRLKKICGFERWVAEKERRPYMEVLGEEKEKMVYLTADAEEVLEEVEADKVYIVGGVVDRNRWKGMTVEKAKGQGIAAAKLPIGKYMKMSSSQVLTVNQVMAILLRFVETKDWGTAMAEVIPGRKRCQPIHGDDDHTCVVEGVKEFL